jgi:hypothetical protein
MDLVGSKNLKPYPIHLFCITHLHQKLYVSTSIYLGLSNSIIRVILDFKILISSSESLFHLSNKDKYWSSWCFYLDIVCFKQGKKHKGPGLSVIPVLHWILISGMFHLPSFCEENYDGPLFTVFICVRDYVSCGKK